MRKIKVVTANPIDYVDPIYGLIATIPGGLECIPASTTSNLPDTKDRGCGWWLYERWPGISPEAESWMDNYGFWLGDDDVTEILIKSIRPEGADASED
jgi:hypothetical protein